MRSLPRGHAPAPVRDRCRRRSEPEATRRAGSGSGRRDRRRPPRGGPPWSSAPKCGSTGFGAVANHMVVPVPSRSARKEVAYGSAAASAVSSELRSQARQVRDDDGDAAPDPAVAGAPSGRGVDARVTVIVDDERPGCLGGRPNQLVARGHDDQLHPRGGQGRHQRIAEERQRQLARRRSAGRESGLRGRQHLDGEDHGPRLRGISVSGDHRVIQPHRVRWSGRCGSADVGW